MLEFWKQVDGCQTSSEIWTLELESGVNLLRFITCLFIEPLFLPCMHRAPPEVS